MIPRPKLDNDLQKIEGPQVRYIHHDTSTAVGCVLDLLQGFSCSALSDSPMSSCIILVGGLEHFLFFHILGIIIPSDFHILFRGIGISPTSI